MSLEASEGKGKAAWGSPGLNVRCVSWGRGSGRDLLDVWTWSKVLFRQREVKLRRGGVDFSLFLHVGKTAADDLVASGA